MQPSQTGHRVFATALGHVGIVYATAGLRRLVLPARDPESVVRRLLGSTARHGGGRMDDAPEKAPAWVASLVEAVRAYATGEAIDFSGMPVDMAAIEPFRRAIYAAARQLGYGETTTYGELARRAGYPGMARETGAALGANPVPLVIPCHRILAAGGRIGGFSAPGGRVTKERMLTLEGVRLGPPPAAQASLPF